MKSFTKTFTPAIDKRYTKEQFQPLDLSVANTALQLDVLQDPERHEKEIVAFLKQTDSQVAYGGYLEKRKLYERSDYFAQGAPDDQRNIHLGIDLWVQEGTSVLAVLDGEIHSFQENTNFGDYGPTIILKHEVDGKLFHTLYGHLSRLSLEGKVVGQKVKAGETIATLGTAKVNGTYAPHLHFQIIKDMQGKSGDYPGVCSKNDLAFYSENCPDPNLLLKIY